MSASVREALAAALGLSIVHSLWQGTILGLLGRLAHARLWHAPPQTRHSAFCALLLTLFAAWLASFACLYGREMRSAGAVQGGAASVSIHLLAANSGGIIQTTEGSLLRSVAPTLALCWAVGVIVLSVRHFGGYLSLQRLRCSGSTPCPVEWQARTAALAARYGVRRPILVRLCRHVDVPVVFGIIRSCILLPPAALIGLPPAQLEALIAHELAHIRNHDALVNLLQLCAETVLFYHPAAWWLSAQIRIAREQRCDDLAVQVIGDQVLYARALLSMEELRLPIPHPALGAKGAHNPMQHHLLTHRIQRVLALGARANRVSMPLGLSALVIALLGMGAVVPVLAVPGKQQDGHVAASAKAEKLQLEVNCNRSVANGAVRETVQITATLHGKKIQLNTLTPQADTAISINGSAAKFSDLSADEQKVLRQAVSHITVAHQAPGTNRQTRIVLQNNGRKIELNTTDLKPDTPVTVNGAPLKFGDLPADEQKEIRNAVSLHHGMSVQRSLAVTSDGKKTEKKMMMKLNVNGKTFELHTTDLKPDTEVVVNGTATKFGDLDEADQNILRDAVKGAHSEHESASGNTRVEKKIVKINIHGKMIELNTTEPTADSQVTIDGVTARFGDLSVDQQKEIQDALSRVHIETNEGK